MERAVGAFVVVLFASLPSAFADSGDVDLGVGLTYASPDEARGDLRLGYGLSQFVSVRAAVGLGVRDDVARALVSGGVVYAYDVVTWVPELGVYGGASVASGDYYGRALALVGLRRYLTATTSIALSAGAEYDWRPGDHLRGLVDLALWF